MSHQKKTGHRLLADCLADGAILPETLHPFLYRIYALLGEHLANRAVNVNWLADQLGIDRKTLYRTVQGLLQQAPVTLIRHYRLHKAADLLRAGHSAGATARLVGFATPSHFTTVFREFYRQTPTEFIASRKKTLRWLPFPRTCPKYDTICLESDKGAAGRDRPLSQQNLPIQSNFRHEKILYRL